MAKMLKILENPPKSIDFVYFRSILGISFENLEIAPSSNQKIIDEKSSDEKKQIQTQTTLARTNCLCSLVCPFAKFGRGSGRMDFLTFQKK